MSLADQKRFHKGREIYKMLCFECHGEDARGRKTDGGQMAPTLVGSPRVIGPPETVLEIIMNGMTGALDGKTYLGGMMFPNKAHDDEWIAAVTTYIRNDFGNHSSPVQPNAVSHLRKKTGDRDQLWTQAELENSHSLYLKPNKDWKVTVSNDEKNMQNTF